jgi:glutamate-5-semialdehyde dehydrogenase
VELPSNTHIHFSSSKYGHALAEKAKNAGAALSQVNEEKRCKALSDAASLIEKNAGKILSENERDVKEAKGKGANEAFLARLRLSQKSIAYLSSTLRAVASLKLPDSEITSWKLSNGLLIRKVRVPLGAFCVIFESRPDVVVEASALALKSGNSLVLKGGSEAKHSNEILVSFLYEACAQNKLPQDSISLFSGSRDDLADLLSRSDCIDLVIPRGGEGLLKFVSEKSRIPVIFAGGGNCHAYAHEDADLSMASEIIINAKAQKPSACNAVETLLVDGKIAKKFLPIIGKKLLENKVRIRACKESFPLLKEFGATAATDEDFATEFLDLIIAIKVVSDISEAISHINKYGTKHSELILTKDKSAYEKFAREVDASAIYWNASTRFTDGGQFGFGAELGISTQKLHARGPLGIDTLFTYKYEIIGNGQIRP